ncbi:MAG: 30S ribosomal protein S3 [bacterium]|nr:30S ribosomal protein S3 [bacterium]
MGQKVHPIGFRLGFTKTWESKWYSRKEYRKNLLEDLRIRAFVKEKLKNAGVSRVEIERASDKVRINIHTARPGIIIGKKGTEVDKLKDEIQALTHKQVSINIHEIRKAEIDAQLIAENVAMQLERRVAFRRAMKKRVTAALRFGAEGIRISCAGRLGGAEMARREWYREGRVPLHTLRADIDYGMAIARTTYGVIGVKVWVFKGEVLSKEQPSKEQLESVTYNV